MLFKKFFVKGIMTIIFMLFANSLIFGQQYKAKEITSGKEIEFHWPQGIKCAVSLSFDDARYSQVEIGIPILYKYDVKATFYVTPRRVEERLEDWKKAVANGHEIGNHTISHPCTGNFTFSRKNALEEYTLEMIAKEMDGADDEIERLLGVRPKTFGYPCGQQYVGRGESLKSYVPVAAQRFIAAREWLSEGANDPAYCDMAQLMGMESDGKDFEYIKKLIDQAAVEGRWLVLAGHEIKEGGRQTTLIPTLEAICEYATDPVNGIWIATVQEIAEYILEQRGSSESKEKAIYLDPTKPLDVRVEDLLSRMTLKEKIGQMNIPTCYSTQIGWGLGSRTPPLWDDPSKENREKQKEGTKKWAEGTHNDVFGPGGGFFTLSDRLIYEGSRAQADFLNELQKIALNKTRIGVPLLQIEEGTHGSMCAGGTVFPEGLAIGATWNMGLVKKIYSTAAKEARSIGVHMLCTLVIEPNRDPRMGRNEEGYSECPHLCSRIAEAIVKGTQGNDISANDKVIAALCHYPGQSEPTSGFERGAMNISERTLRTVFLPPWVAGIKKCGALGVMATYPAIDGVPVHSSDKILTKILREELEFKGIVLGEGGGLGTIVYEKVAPTQKEAGIWAIRAGVDVGISIEDAYMGGMIENINEGKVNIEEIDRAVRRILRLKFQLGLFENPFVDPDRADKICNSEEHRELALQVAREGIVLLKNEGNLLPLKKDIKSIAVIGPNADAREDQLGDYIPHNIPQEVVSVLKGIKNKVSKRTKVTYVKGCSVIGDKLNEISKARSAAKKADVAVVVVGEEGYGTNGEGRDVADLDLTGLQKDLIKAVYETGTPTIAVLINGRPLSIRWTAEHVPAIVEAWMCGEQGGNAVADVLFGDYNPSGKLPITVPRHVGQLPVYYNHSPSKTRWIKRGYVNMPGTPLYEFGYGLSYTKFEYGNLQISKKEIGTAGEIEISLDVENTGNREGEEVVQLYINDIISTVTTPAKELRDFEKIALKPGEKKTVKFNLTPEHLMLLDRNMKWVVEPGTFNVMVGASSEDIKLKGSFKVVN